MRCVRGLGAVKAGYAALTVVGAALVMAPRGLNRPIAAITLYGFIQPSRDIQLYMAE